LTIESFAVNLILIVNLILVIWSFSLFSKMLQTGKNKPGFVSWKLILIGVCIFIVETFLTIFRVNNIWNIPRVVNGLFELAIICIFIYIVLFQRISILAVEKRGLR
jgi:hypothetical protein